MSRKGTERGIYERPPDSGKWYACFCDASGKFIRKLCGTKENARAYYLKSKARAIEEELFPERAAAKAARLTVAQLVERYKPEWQTKATSAKDDMMAAWWVARLGPRQASSIKTADVAQARAGKLAEITHSNRPTMPATANRYVSFLKRLYNLAIRDHLLGTNPASGIALPRLKEQHSIKYVEQGSLQVLLAACDASGMRMKIANEKLKRAIIVAVGTGMRESEQFGMHRRQINWGNKTITLGNTKSRETRYLAMSAPVEKALREQCASHKSEWVWPGRDETGPCDATAVARCFKRAIDRAGLPPVSWHGLRHSFGTWSVAAGADIVSVKEALGQSSLAVTQIYAQVNAKRVRSVFDAVGACVTGVSPEEKKEEETEE